VDRHTAALVLDEIASLLELRGGERFRVRAYRTAARALDRLEGELSERLRSDDLTEVQGLGPGTVGVIRELAETGRSRLYDRLRAETPAGLVRLRSVPGLGPKRIRTLHRTLGVGTLDDLREAAESGRVKELPGFGPATQRAILEGLDFVDRSAGRRRQPQAYATAHRLVALVEGLPGVRRVRLAGELRRRCETVDGIDLLAVTEAPGPVLDAFLAVPSLTAAERNGTDAVRAALADGARVRLRCVPPSGEGAAWIVETGSAGHVERLTERAAERGVALAGEDEASVYENLGLPWIPPELREGTYEIEDAETGRLPTLVELDDLRGTFHCHTTWSDGRATVREMARSAMDRGWRYLGIADHSQAAGYAGGLTPDEVRRQQAEIDAWNADHGDTLRLFKGVEADILRDGSLDYDDGLLATFDYVVGSVHSAFRIGEAAMTRRIRAAIAHPRLTILGHPTGRLLLNREPYAVDLDAVVDAAAERGAAIEINGDPHRMDMDWRHWRRAREQGVRCAIDPDAHSVAGLGAVAYGVAMARKGGLEAGDVINTWELERVASYFGGR
jgi:DNA polymerase (family 10)